MFNDHENILIFSGLFKIKSIKSVALTTIDSLIQHMALNERVLSDSPEPRTVLKDK